MWKLWFLSSVVLFTSLKPTYAYPVDFSVVYTWVNGSDPELLEDMTHHKKTISTARIRDREELRFSLRSLEKYMPWFQGEIIIFTNHNPPNWLNTVSTPIFSLCLWAIDSLYSCTAVAHYSTLFHVSGSPKDSCAHPQRGDPRDLPADLQLRRDRILHQHPPWPEGAHSVLERRHVHWSVISVYCEFHLFISIGYGCC